MYQPKIKRYQKKFEYSYAFGAYPVLELLNKYPQHIYKVLFNSKGLSSDGIEEIKKICLEKNILTEINDRGIEKISVKENTYVVAIFKKYESNILENVNHIVLVNPSNMGNLGTIVRTMLGFGLKDLALIKPCVDIFDPLGIRSTMGALFNIRFEYFNTIDEYLSKFPNQNLYPFMLNGSKSINDVKFKTPFTLIHGNESTGLDERYLNIGESVYIPHSKDIDSLNLSVATSISIWESVKNEV